MNKDTEMYRKTPIQLPCFQISIYFPEDSRDIGMVNCVATSYEITSV